MEKKIKLAIISPERELFNGEVTSVTLPGSAGSFSVLPNHAPLVSSLDKGMLKYTSVNQEEHAMEIVGGFVEVSNNQVSVCLTK